MVRQCYLQEAMASIAYNASILIHNYKMELTKFEIRLLLKHYWTQHFKAAVGARRICEVEGEGVVSERVTQRWYQHFNTEEENTKYLPCSGRKSTKKYS